MIKFALYAVSMFWVEVTYDAKDNKITGIKSFVGGETLDKYSNVPMEKVSELLGTFQHKDYPRVLWQGSTEKD